MSLIHHASFEAEKSANLDYLQTSEIQKQSISLRGSVMVVGPLLGSLARRSSQKPG